MGGWSISRTDMAWPAIMTSPTSRFGTRGFSSGSHRIEEFLSFRSSPIGSGPAARLAVLFSMTGNGSTLVRAPNTWKSIVRSRTVGDPVMSRIWSGRFVWQRVPKWPRARSFPDFFPPGRIGSQILSDPLFAGSDAHPGEIQSGTRRKSALRADRELSRQARHSGAEDLFS